MFEPNWSAIGPRLRLLISAGFVPLAGCAGVQSTLDPAGLEASQIATLFWMMAGGGALIWLSVVGVMLYAMRRSRSSFSERGAGRLILWGGAIVPSFTLLLLLAYALWLMPGLRPFAQAEKASLGIEVVGKQFWWQVSYKLPDGAVVAAANEVRLPLGERIEFTLKSDDVIHSFWIPALGGKMDMIPGRTNRLSLLATEAGTFRGPCAEFCGTSHALMAFTAIVMEREEFDRWLERERQPSAGAHGEGAQLFRRHGCGACHAIAGTDSSGTSGPDLSHIGSRATVAAGILPNTAEAIARFIANPDIVKPGSHMPAFAMLPPGEIDAMAVYLRGLE